MEKSVFLQLTRPRKTPRILNFENIIMRYFDQNDKEKILSMCSMRLIGDRNFESKLYEVCLSISKDRQNYKLVYTSGKWLIVRPDQLDFISETLPSIYFDKKIIGNIDLTNTWMIFSDKEMAKNFDNFLNIENDENS